MNIQDRIRVQGRRLSGAELSRIQQLIEAHPQWSRHRVARELCGWWEWRTALGRWKTFAARSLLLKLEQDYELRLPPVRTANRRTPWGLGALSSAEPVTGVPARPVAEGLSRLQPLRWLVGLYGSEVRQRGLSYLRQYHYLGCNRPVGAHLIYLVQDAWERDLAVHLVGAAAWQCAARDRYIGWLPEPRRANLPRIANHSRFLILPWVKVPHLASHLLGELTHRIGADWQAQHGEGLELLESFVEQGRFHGVAYQAANWQCVGQTTGRTRQGKAHGAIAPCKSVWVYALRRNFRSALGVPPPTGGCP